MAELDRNAVATVMGRLEALGRLAGSIASGPTLSRLQFPRGPLAKPRLPEERLQAPRPVREVRDPSTPQEF